jgi:hypothetical protein
MLDPIALSLERLVHITKRFIDRHEAVTWVNELCVDNASGTVIPIGAIKTLMADAVYVLVTAITDSVMSCVAARLEEGVCQWV